MLFKKRLNVVFTGFGQDLGFSMRTFRFVTGDSATKGQQQTMRCNLYLEPVGLVLASQPDDCICHTQEECEAPGNI